MTVAQEPDLQRFVFEHADWDFYEEIHRRLEGRRVFVTYYKGKLEVVTTSFLHERIAFLLYRLLCILSEETATPMTTAGRATLRDVELDEGVEADCSFYVTHAGRMAGKDRIDLAVDPPPDLAIEVEVTRRLGERRLVYRDLGVPELWRFTDQGLSVLLKGAEDYHPADRSPTFPQLSPDDVTALIRTGLSQDDTTWAVATRRHVQDVLRRLP